MTHQIQKYENVIPFEIVVRSEKVNQELVAEIEQVILKIKQCELPSLLNDFEADIWKHYHQIDIDTFMYLVEKYQCKKDLYKQENDVFYYSSTLFSRYLNNRETSMKIFIYSEDIEITKNRKNIIH